MGKQEVEHWINQAQDSINLVPSKINKDENKLALKLLDQAFRELLMVEKEIINLNA